MPTGALPTAWPRPARPRLGARLAYLVHRLVAPNPFWRRVARLIEATRPGYRLFTAAEKAVKTELFGCRMCGQCALPVTGYACPMTCPKQLRNGPCGGVGADGSCEVYPGQRCVWLVAFERAERQGRVADLQLIQRPVDQRQWGRSSWVNYWSGRDAGLWADPGGPAFPQRAAPGWEGTWLDRSPGASEALAGAPAARRTAREAAR